MRQWDLHSLRFGDDDLTDEEGFHISLNRFLDRDLSQIMWYGFDGIEQALVNYYE